MHDTHGLSEERLALLEKYLCGNASSITTAAQVKPTRKTTSPVLTPPKTDSRASIAPVQVSGSKRPFFFLHGDWTDNAFFCFPLAHDLGQDQPFYALEPYTFDGLSIPPSTEVMAAAHVTSLRAYQSEGPYRLGGFCNGGLVAYEMARQLHKQGQKIELLVLVDSIPARTASICTTIHRIGKFMCMSKEQELHWFLHLRHTYKFTQFSHERRYEDMEQLKKIDARLGKIFAPTHLLHQDYPGMFTWATANYVPSFYPGKVTLFWEEAEPFRKVWWDEMAKGKDAQVEEHIIHGNHITCRTDHLASMAERLRACLDAVEDNA